MKGDVKADGKRQTPPKKLNFHHLNDENYKKTTFSCSLDLAVYHQWIYIVLNQ